MPLFLSTPGRSSPASSIAGSASPAKYSTPLYSCVDGNSALAHVAYGVSDVALLYPVAAGDHLGTSLERLADEGLPNCFGEACQVTYLDTKTGAGSAALGSLSTGALSTVFASSQSITAMLPNLHKLTRERKSAVFHVSASSVDADLMQSSGYSDVLRAVHTGFGMLHSNNVQECHDLALVAHLAAHKASLPFMHFYDGTRTAHEVSKAQLIPYSKLSKVAEMLADKDIRPEMVSKKRIPDVVDDLMAQLRRVFKRRYRLFEYSGPVNAEFVIVSLCAQAETAALSHAVSQAVAKGLRVGLLQVRLLRPWSTRHFLQSIPLGTLKRCAVVVGAQQDAAATNMLFSDVVASVPLGHSCHVLPATLPGAVDVAAAQLLVERLCAANAVADLSVGEEEWLEAASKAEAPSLRADIKTAVVWEMEPDVGADNSTVELARVLGESSGIFVHALQAQDAYHMRGHVVNTRLHVSAAAFAPPAVSAGLADLVVVADVRVLDMYDVTAGLKSGGVVLVNTSASTADEFEGELAGAFRRQLAVRKLKMLAVDLTAFEHGALATQLALLLQGDLLGQGSLGRTVDYVRSALTFPLAHHHALEVHHLNEIVEAVGKALRPVNIPEAWVGEILADAPPLPAHIVRSSFVRARTELAAKPKHAVGPWHAAAKQLMFPHAFAVNGEHRPQDGPKETSFVIKVSKNLRVTPDNYDRNVFHMELDTTGTGLNYGIGDALGIYATNPTSRVQAFMKLYGLDAHDTVSIRARHTGVREMRSVEHVLTQRMDLFGRPSKAFYAQLAKHATEQKEVEQLEKLAGKTGAVEFKKRVEATVTFADLLAEFGSARPSFAQLMELVPDMKPRHYSIASSQHMHPNSVHLLIVLVAWETPSGEQRYGQATQFLVDLAVGASLSVCVKPSVMKLPEDPMAPVAMAGLGTGMAPFRAFVQERAWQHAQGIPVGPMSLYFGSRSMFQEYLYGDELEAYHQSGLLTNLRCAFSRDGPNKVYIQHKIQEDAKQLHEYLGKSNGQFYLCGPTWPAGDVQDAITEAFVRFGSMSAGEAAKAVNDLKEEERYILEVY